jgi:hypothetical protein
MIIRLETPSDIAAIRVVEEAAFPTPAEARMVDDLRAAGDAVFSLVAVEDAMVVGHVMFSKRWRRFRPWRLARSRCCPSDSGPASAVCSFATGLRRAKLPAGPESSSLAIPPITVASDFAWTRRAASSRPMRDRI